MYGESHTMCKLKNHTVIQIGYLYAFILQPRLYNVNRLFPPRKFRRNGRKKERKAVFYSIAHKYILFLMFRNMIWIVLKYCFC